MVGLGETYFPAFVLAMSHNQIACGLTATVPMVAGALLQLVTPRAVARLRSYRVWVVICAVVQALSFVPLILAAIHGAMSVMAAFAVIAIYWATNLGSGAVWNAWVSTIVPQRIRASYFARRTVLCQAGLLVGIVGGGLLLQWGAHHENVLWAFAVIFAAAAAGRLLSSWFLFTQSEPKRERNDRLPWELRSGVGRFHYHPTGRLIIYLFAVQTAVQMSGPYFTPYMLRQLELSYASYVVLISTAYVAKIFTLPYCGQIAARFGANRLMWLGGAAIVPIAGLWNFSSDFVYLCVVQVLSGAAWGAFELAMLLLFFEAIPRERRVAVLTMYNVANALAYLVGSLLGGALLGYFGPVREAYLLLFLVSSVGRLAALGLLAWVAVAKPQSTGNLAESPIYDTPEPTRPRAIRPDPAQPIAVPSAVFLRQLNRERQKADQNETAVLPGAPRP